MSTPPAPRGPLTCERIVRAALALVDAAGRDALTMRRLGAELGVEAMSLYKHVPNKEAILDGIRELLIAGFAASLPADPATGWRDDLARFAGAYRAVGRAHPEAFGLLASAPGRAYVAGSDLAETALERLEGAGPGRDEAIRAQRSVSRFVLGTSLLERAAEAALPPLAGPELAALTAERPGSRPRGSPRPGRRRCALRVRAAGPARRHRPGHRGRVAARRRDLSGGRGGGRVRRAAQVWHPGHQ